MYGEPAEDVIAKWVFIEKAGTENILKEMHKI